MSNPESSASRPDNYVEAYLVAVSNLAFAIMEEKYPNAKDREAFLNRAIARIDHASKGAIAEDAKEIIRTYIKGLKPKNDMEEA